MSVYVKQSLAAGAALALALALWVPTVAPVSSPALASILLATPAIV